MYNNQLSKLFLVFPPKRPESRVAAEISAVLLWGEAKRAKETTTSGGSLRNAKSSSCDATKGKKGLSLFLFLNFSSKTLNSKFNSLLSWKNLDVVVILIGDAFDDGLLEKSSSLFTSERTRARGTKRRGRELWCLASFATVTRVRGGEC